MAKMWAGRFKKETDRMVNEFNASLCVDSRLYREEIEGSMAPAAMLARPGINPTEAGEAIRAGTPTGRGSRAAGGAKPPPATTANTVSGQLEAALDRAWLQVSSGAFDYQTSIRRAVNGLARNMTGVTYPTGHRDTLEVAVRRAVLTGVNQTAGKLQIARMDEMDWAFVETSAHAGARPSHAKWQGRQYHRGRAVTYRGKYYPDFEKATGYGTGAGLCGWNCRHGFFAIDPDLDPRPAYTEEELAALDAKDIEYRGKKYSRYQINQRQRALERHVRAAKKVWLAEDAAGLDSTQSAVRLRQARQDLAQFVKDTGGRNDSSRTFVSGFSRSQASRATAQAKRGMEILPAYRYKKDGTVVVTDDRTGAARPRVDATYKPFAVVDTLSQRGTQRDRTFYDAEGRMTRQVSSGPHGNPKRHPFGQHGEHAHDILWEDGKISGRPVRDLTDQERKENKDIL